ncbi:hypothetical protein NZ45_11350 [Clostridium botulinum]|uniref:Uncharacterized protein n=1 Tax=Clostridium botulinum TaxID=1491 RepID=A0ABD7CLE0_CLOBO|nr:hypothetical protein [Clostridium botulinum]KGO13619.1 hypothetical protein NZ45_11350 [Clostridium botulinum]QRI54235.1 hypothetical protein JQS73_03705 [Clostridium botulinum]
MKNIELIELYDKIIYTAIETILAYSIIIALIHPISLELAIILILPMLYLGIKKIGNLKSKSTIIKILSVIYGIVSGYILIVCIISGFLENATINVAYKNISINSLLILSFLLLSIFVYKRNQYEKIDL